MGCLGRGKIKLMTRKSYFTRLHLGSALLTPLLACSLLGCSFFKNLSTEQCTNDSECKQFGADYACSAGGIRNGARIRHASAATQKRRPNYRRDAGKTEAFDHIE